MLDCQICTTNIDGVSSIPEGGRHFQDWTAVGLIGNAGIGTEDIDGLLKVLYGLCDGLGNRVLVTDVALEAVEIGICGRRERVRTDIVSRDFVALC